MRSFRTHTRGIFESRLEIAHASVGPTDAECPRNFCSCGTKWLNSKETADEQERTVFFEIETTVGGEEGG